MSLGYAAIHLELCAIVSWGSGKKEIKKERPLCAGLFLQRPGDMDKKVIHVKKERECRRASALVILIFI